MGDRDNADYCVSLRCVNVKVRRLKRTGVTVLGALTSASRGDILLPFTPASFLFAFVHHLCHFIPLLWFLLLDEVAGDSILHSLEQKPVLPAATIWTTISRLHLQHLQPFHNPVTV